LVVEIPARLVEAVGERQRHARVVRPLAGCEVVRTTCAETAHRLEGAGILELDGCAERVAHREAEQGAPTTVTERNGHDLERTRRARLERAEPRQMRFEAGLRSHLPPPRTRVG
jgi:hypothetical protein